MLHGGELSVTTLTPRGAEEISTLRWLSVQGRLLLSTRLQPLTLDEGRPSNQAAAYACLWCLVSLAEDPNACWIDFEGALRNAGARLPAVAVAVYPHAALPLGALWCLLRV